MIFLFFNQPQVFCALDYIVASWLDIARVAIYKRLQAISSNSERHQVLNYKVQALLVCMKAFQRQI